MQSDWAAQVLRYWFEELRPEAWFRKDERVDAAIRERFGALHEQLAQIRPEQLATPLESVAAVIVLDQFPRNMFRGSPRAFATDALALSIAQHAIAAGFDQQLDAAAALVSLHAVSAQRRSRGAGALDRVVHATGRSRESRLRAASQGNHRSLRPLSPSQRSARSRIDAGRIAVHRDASRLLSTR